MNIDIYKFIRTEDVSGVSGTGHVANVIDTDQGTFLFWKTDPGSYARYNSLDDLLEIHDHQGGSELEKVELYGL